MIDKHALAATDGKTYAELAQDDPLREMAMTVSFPRALPFSSVLAYGVAAMAAALGLVLILIAVALMRLGKEPEVEDPAVS